MTLAPLPRIRHYAWREPPKEPFDVKGFLLVVTISAVCSAIFFTELVRGLVWLFRAVADGRIW